MASPADIEIDHIARAARAGDGAALDELLRRVRPRVFRWAVVRTRDPDEAEDVVQEVALILVHRLDGYRDGSFTAWLYRVTANVVHDARKRWTRRRTVRWSQDVEATQQEHAVAQGTLETLVGRELAEALGRFLRDLPLRQREVLDLVDVQGHSAVAAAGMLGIEPSTARVHLLRARRAMRQRLLEEDPDADM